ncbi:hypothetical protein T4D_7382 [Trichinella pseudospiralis]|uniref:Uncharacterized protein n=1 Tax=Trichinella pseudospiralis TaxID=6337 RepID=A0A0V1G5Z7_TRIPS|nr:hypothetical protein T4D_7382 [Trichinella pseudospiralis]
MIANCFNYVIMHGYKQLLKYLTDNVAPQDKSMLKTCFCFLHILRHSSKAYFITFSVHIFACRSWIENVCLLES